MFSILHLLTDSYIIKVLLEHLGSRVLSLLLVDVLHQNSLVLEDVSLALHVKIVIPINHIVYI